MGIPAWQHSKFTFSVSARNNKKIRQTLDDIGQVRKKNGQSAEGVSWKTHSSKDERKENVITI